MHGFEIVHTEYDLSRAAGSPTLEEPRATSGAYDVNRSVGALSCQFSGAQRQVLPHDEGHGWCIMHRCHAVHPSPARHLPGRSNR